MGYVKTYYNKNAAATIRYVLAHTGPADPVDGENCVVDQGSLVEQFKAVRDAHGAKDSFNQCVHIMQSWGPQESKALSPGEFNKMGVALASEYFPGHQVLVVTHTDRKHLHNHIVVGTVHPETGKRIHNKKQHLHKLREINDRLCQEKGLSVIDGGRQRRRDRMPDKVQRMVRFNSFSYLMDMKQKADFARHYATSYDEYVGILSEFGISARVEEKNISYLYPGQKRAKRGKNLGRGYDKPGLEAAFKTNDGRFQERPDLRQLWRDEVGHAGARAGASSGNAKDYSRYAVTSRRELQQGKGPALDLSRSLIPVSEMAKARRTNILDYCRRKGIELTKNDKDQWTLKGREYVVIRDIEWMNTRNHTRGSLIDLVAMHKNVGYLQAIAEINNNPRLLLLEKYFGQSKRTFTSFYIPTEKRASRAESALRLGALIAHFGAKSPLSDRLIDQQRAHVSREGVIRLFGRGDEGGALEFHQDDGGKWQRRRVGQPSVAFFSSSGRGKKAVVHTDPIGYMRHAGDNAMKPSKNGDPLLVLTAPDAKQVDLFLVQNPHVKSLQVVTFDPHKPSRVELDLFNNLRARYHEHGISVEIGGIEAPARTKGPDMPMF